MNLVNLNDIQTQPQLISLKEGSVCISVALWGVVVGLLALGVGIGKMIAYILARHKEKKKAKMSLEQVQMELNRNMREIF